MDVAGLFWRDTALNVARRRAGARAARPCRWARAFGAPPSNRRRWSSIRPDRLDPP